MENEKQAELEDLRKQTAHLLHQAGELQYIIDCQQGELGEINVKLRNLSTRANQIQKQMEAPKLEEVKNETI